MPLLKIALLFIFSSVVSAETYKYPITRVIDGDTVEFTAKFLPKPLKPVLSLRILGVDTPEKGFRAGCPEEAALGVAASEYTKNLVAKSKKHQIVITEWDKYGGRVLGDLYIDGENLATKLIANGFARPYFGEKKESWCK